MYLWRHTVTVYRKVDGDFARTELPDCGVVEKVQYNEVGGAYIREKVYTCRIPVLLGFLPQVGDIICIGNEQDIPKPGKEGQFVEGHRAFIVREVKDNTLTGALPHFCAKSKFENTKL